MGVGLKTQSIDQHHTNLFPLKKKSRNFQDQPHSVPGAVTTENSSLCSIVVCEHRAKLMTESCWSDPMFTKANEKFLHFSFFTFLVQTILKSMEDFPLTSVHVGSGSSCTAAGSKDWRGLLEKPA